MAKRTVEDIEARGSTNAYKALDDACKLVAARASARANASVLFFTDGVPEISPPRGECEALRKLKRT